MKTPRYLRYAIFSIAVLLFACVSNPTLATEYPGGFVEWTQPGTVVGLCPVVDTGQITNVSLFINSASTSRGFENNTMVLISPDGTDIYLFDLLAYQISGASLFHTRFIDTAPVIITDGIPPYVGSFQPGESFFNFNGEWMTGTWTLAVYNNANGNIGAVTDWSLIINQATPIPTPSPVLPTPTPISVTYKEYPGSSFSWNGIGATTGTIGIEEQGIVYEVNLKLSANATGGLVPIGMYLQSPEGDSMALFNQNQLADYSLYLTTFDDSADQPIISGVAPYIGPYRPVDNLAFFNNQSLIGDWSLIVYSNSADAGEVTDWSLIIGSTGRIGTPTPTITPRTSVTTTPVGYKTPSPTPTAMPSPTPADYCPVTSGSPFTALGQQVKWCPIQAPTTEGRVDKVTLYINEFHITGEGDLDFVGMWLVSPNDTVVELFPKHVLEEHALSATWFNDSATREITEGLGPYIGEWRPTGLLSDFNGEDIAGTWNLVIYNDYVCEQDPDEPPCEDSAELAENWVLEICPMPPSPTQTPTPDAPTPTPTPFVPPPQPACTGYSGGSITGSSVGTFSDILSISDSGSVVDVKVELTFTCSEDLDSVGIYLRSPSDIDVALFEKHELDEHALYQTIFTDDSQYPIISIDSVSPYLGSFRPTSWDRDVNDNCTGGFCEFNGDSVKGDWTLLVYNDTSGNSINLEYWKLTICKFPSPTPSPTSTPAPTPYVLPPPPTPILILQSGDYDGDGTSDIGVFRSATGLWSIRSVGTSWFGQLSDLPASGDYDGDGTADISIYRGSSSLWAISGITRVYFGGSSDTTIPGDYDGDGICDIGIYRSSSGLWAIRGVTRLYFGASGDYPIPGDYDGDGFCDVAIFRPVSGLWAVEGVTRVYFGTADDLPIPRDYDGDGSSDIGIVRFSSGLWAIRGVSRFYFGASGDYPVPADYAGSGTAYPGIFRSSSGLWAIKEVTRVYHGTSGDIPVAR